MKIAALFIALTALVGSSSVDAVLIKPYSQQGSCLYTGGNPAGGGDWDIVPTTGCSGAANQNWALDDVPGLNFYTFSTSTSCSPSTKVIEAQGTWNAAPVQQVEFVPTHKTAYWNQISLGSSAVPGYYFYQNTASGRCLTADVAGNPTTIWDCVGTGTHQLWNVTGPTVKNQQFSANCLDVKGGSGSSGATITTNVCNPHSGSQKFNVLNKKVYMLRNLGTGRCVDGGVQYILATYQFGCVPTAGNQHWMPIQFPGENNPGGFVYFMNMYSGWCLSLIPGTWTSATASFACQEGNVNQQWLVV